MSDYITFGDYQSTGLFDDDVIVFRQEQEDAIDKALNHFCSSKGRGANKVYTPLDEFRKFLWNAKMRFGKTLCALELARRMGVKRTLIVTHRPVVDDGWKEDFQKIFHDTNYSYATRTDEEENGDFYSLNRKALQGEAGFVFFVSMQFLRLSEILNDKTQAKNKTKSGGGSSNENERLKAEILNADWDLVVVDEAHEGTRTSLGMRVIDEFLKKKTTKMLHLSGTPFNLYEDFKENEIFTWDYISEQQAKRDWPLEHPNEPNPYAELPQMKMFTYDITKNIQDVLDHNGIFTFTEFFRTWSGNPRKDGASMPDGALGKFVHEAEVNQFLDLLCTKDNENNFPFATDEYRRQFRHTLWVVSHIDEAKALTDLLRKHPKFKEPRFKVINVAGNGDDDEQMENALDEVKKAIGDNPERTATITISCGRLTTGVTIRPWTAVLYLKGGDRAATYMQTIFRVQSPYKTNDGKMKTTCFVFDFMPDRTLKIVAETSKFSSMAKAKEAKKKGDSEEDDLTQEQRDKQTVADFVELCPLISMQGGIMSPMEVGDIYKRLESVFIDRLITKGFDDNCLYVQDELNKIDPEILNEIGKNGGEAPDEKRKEANPIVDLSHMTEEQRKAWEENIRRKKAAAAAKAAKKLEKDEEFRKKWESWDEKQRQEYLRQEAEKAARREEAKKQREEFKKRISNIRGIALRIPLLMYGGADAGDPNEDLTVDNFTRKIKDESWAEFMPKGISKSDFNKIKKCFNATRFEEAGKRYREMTREADFMHIRERIERITWIFDSFRNPDKETVLTPWRVVNMHMSDTLGGYCFFNERFDGPNEKFVEGTEGRLFDIVSTSEPRFVNHGNVTTNSFGKIKTGQGIASHILEINSKTGLYPLYVAYSMYRKLLAHYDEMGLLDNPVDNLSVNEEQTIWDDVVANNIFVITNTPMAAHITLRTLMGFREPSKKLNIKSDKLIERATTDREALVKAIKTIGYWNGTTSKAMIEFDAVVGNPPYMIKKEDTSDKPIYNEFMDLAFDISSLVTPARFLFNAGKTPDAWNKKVLSDPNLKVTSYFPNSGDVFPNVDIKGGVAITIHDKLTDFGAIGIFTAFSQLNSIIKKVVNREDFSSIDTIIFQQNKFNLEMLYEDYPEYRLLIGSDGREKRLTTSIFQQLPIFTVAPISNQCIRVLGLIDNNRVYRYFPKKYLDEHPNLNKFKVLLPASNGSGALGEVLSTPLVGEPLVGYTQSFIGFGAFSERPEADAALKYIRSKFARVMLGILKVTQHNHKDVWQYVPIQDFTASSDVDWSKSVQEIDRQLYAKYGLSESEQEFIETNIKSME